MVLDVAAQQAVEAVDATDVLELVEGDERAVATRRLEARRQVEQRVQRRQRVAGRLELEPRADPERPEREPDPGSLEERLDTPRSSPFRCRAYARSSRTVTSAIEETRYRSTSTGMSPSLRSPSWSARLSRLVLPYLRGAYSRT